MMTRKHCYGCKHLITEVDAAGGGVYKCSKFPYVVVGEWGHWTDERDEPREINDCWEGSENREMMTKETDND